MCKIADSIMETKLNLNKTETCNEYYSYQQLVGSVN